MNADSTFVAVLYTSDSERVMRYTDEGETSELCKWTVDLSTLPSFQEHARMGNQVRLFTFCTGVRSNLGLIGSLERILHRFVHYRE